MYLERALCESIQQLYPDVGECEEDVSVELHEEADRWTVELSHPELDVSPKTYISMEDATSCLEDDRCTSLALEVLQLLDQLESEVERGP